MAVKQVQLFVGTDQVDIFDPESLRLVITYSIAELNRIDSRSGSRSKTVQIPATDQNKQVFGFTENPNSVNALDQTVKPNTKVIVDGVTILIGSVKITDVILDGADNVIAYKIQLLGNNGTWKTELDDLSLQDIDFSDQDHVWNKATVDLSETVATVRDYVYPLISYGAFDPNINFEVDDFTIIGGNAVTVTLDGSPDISWVVQGIYFRLSGMNQISKNLKYLVLSATATTITAIATTNIGPGATNETNSDGVMNIVRAGSVQLTSRYPAVNIKAIMDRIFLEAEYTISSDFFNTSFFKGLYLPFSRKSFLHADGFADNQQFRSGMGSDLDLTTSSVETTLPLSVDSGGEFFDTGGNWNTTTFKYVATENIRQRFRLEILYTNVLPSFPFVRIRKNNSIVAKKNLKEGTDVLDVIETPYLDLDIGDEVVATVQNILAINVTNTFIVKSANTRFFNTTLDDIIEGSTVQLSPNLPDISQIDFIRGIKHLFNLYFSTDVLNREVVIEPRDDFFQSDEVIDWSEKVDMSIERTFQFMGANLGETNMLEFKTGNDAIINLVNDRNDLRFGSSQNIIANKFTTKKFNSIINPVFSATIMGSHSKVGFIKTLIPRLWEKYIFYPTWNTDYVPRILFYDGVKAMETGEEWIWENAIRTDYPRMYSFNNLEDNNNTVHFNDTLRSNGLFERYYRNTFKQIDEGRIMTAWIDLNEADIGNLDFRKTIFIELGGTGTYWELEKISNYNPLERKSTKCVLVKVVKTVEIAAVQSTVDSPEQPPEESFDIDASLTTEPNNFIATAEAGMEFDQGGNLMNKNAGNISNVDDAVVIGMNLEASGVNQIVMGKNNVSDPKAKFIVGAGDPLFPENVFKVDGDGNLQAGDAQEVWTEVDGEESPVTYVDVDNNIQTVKS